jgi:hypothetical protein
MRGNDPHRFDNHNKSSALNWKALRPKYEWRGWERSLAVRGLLLLGVVGAALYELLLLTDNAISPGETNTVANEKAPAGFTNDRALRSWGGTLPALVIKPRSNDGPHWPVNDQSDVSSKKPAELRSVEKAKMVLAARLHSEPLVSSPTVRIFSPGTELRLVERQSGWVELIDSVTRMRGWMLESYVSLLEDPGSRQVAMDLPAEPQVSKPTPAKPASRARQNTRSVKPGQQVAMSSPRNGKCGVVDGRVEMSDGVGSGYLDAGSQHLRMFREPLSAV